ncbi:MAG: Maf family protein [Pseudoflavonifractor sp.]|nr:Maf family protein [Pseudoflavonifractor sp.]
MELILASQSPRRRELLKQMGFLDFRIVTPDIDERMDRALPPDRLVETISAEKAGAVAAQVGPDALVIAADTVVTLEGAVLGKPVDAADARRMLAALSGRRHRVYTGFTVLRGGETVTRSEATEVAFRSLSPQEIDAYVSTGEPLDKAGAYGIQGVGAMLVEGIQGDYFNVMGLPVCALGRVLAGFGIDCLALSARR